MLIQPHDHILFYGDSITDCGRSRENLTDLGGGYAKLLAGRLLSQFPKHHLSCTNRGVSGNRIYDLESRLEEEVLPLKPTLVSILIGINDTWRAFDRNITSPIPEFEASYGRIIERLRGELGARIVILEPFLLPIPEDRAAWRADLDPRIGAIRRLAAEYKLPYVPLDGAFAAAATEREAAYWLPDGVHPTLAGHGLIAAKWWETVVG
jgi:acyl-CoA thioesterase-1